MFKKDLYPFFDENELLDNYLAEGIELLSRRRGEGGKGYVDYSSLSIRHLGSIYEGLLEYKLRYAETDLAIEVDRGKEIYREAEEGEEVAVSKGDIYRVTDKGERKATGSYYTPDYIVKYIVENTVGPIVDERIDKAEKESKEVVDYLLGIKILDPAMGSGHFLVEATNFLSHRIIEYMQDSGSYEEIPDLNEMKRKVVEKSIYGIDMNPLAVELAKVSLWLDTVSKYKALSFLDHHLQCGNSLIGAGFEDIIKALPTKKRKKMKGGDKISSQITLFGSEFSSAVRDMIKKRMEIESLPSDTAMDMRKKERLHEETKVLTQRFKEILDIHTSQFFGNKASPGEFYNLIVYIKSDSGKWGLFKRKTWFQDAMKISKEKEFFNWELSFPEIFFDEYGSMKDSPGFDAVIGNPPYINLNWISPKIRWVLKDLFPDLWMGQADLYYFFIGQSLNKLKNLGQFSFIVSRYFIESHFAAGLRSLIAKEFNLQKIIDFRNEEIFPEIGIDSAIIHIENSNPKEKSAQIFYPKKNFDVSKPIEFQIKLVSELTCEEQNKSPWSILTFDERRLLDKVKKHSYLLKKEFVAGKGYETGLNDLYTITKEEIKKYNLKKNQVRQVVSNSEIHSYYFSPLTKYWIYLEDTNEEEFKNNKILYNLFLKNEDRLKNRLAYKRGDCLWYRYNYPRYIKEFHKPKLMTSYLSEKNAFQLDEKGRILGSTDVFIIAPQNKPKENLKYLLAILNSKLLTRIYRFYGKLSGGGVYSYSKHSLNLLPIRNIKFDTNKNVRSQLYEQLIRLFKNFDCEQIMEVVESLIPIDSKRNIVIEQEKSDVVHDFLAFLAEQMIEMKKKEHKLDGALDLFKYLPFDLQVQKFRWLFDEEIKYGRVINNEILKKFHDLNDFWLEKEGDEWILMAELKLRDDQNPKNFLKEGSKIKKEWRKLYAFDMDDEKAEYYKAIFENLFKFENSKIPSGYKKRVKEKLFQSQLPVFDEDKGKAIAPYLEIYTEL
ncbi:MAG: Eco57I restriction-modification methylase domain-containing protein [Candidatus Hydrothermarchaeales archaeon]